METSAARLAANQANAQHSTGPRTESGRAKSSMNAVKTGLTSQTVLLPTDDAAAYQAHLDRHHRDHSPANDQEKTLVQLIADTEWRLLRILPLESSITSIAREQCAPLVAHIEDPAEREARLRGQIFLTFRKELNNLYLQERRLRNHLKADTDSLRTLQQERLAQAEKDLKAQNYQIVRANAAAANAKNSGIAFNPLDHGFVFSTEEMAAYNEKNRVHVILFAEVLSFTTWLAGHRAAGKESKAA